MRIRSLLFSALTLALLLSAGTAQAYPDLGGEFGFCTACHIADPDVNVSVTFQGCVDLSAHYAVSVSLPSSPGHEGWAVFLGTANIHNGYGPTGSFAVAGGVYTMYGASWGLANSVSFEAPQCAVCTDLDLDGFNVDGGGCGPLDCNDADAAVHPGAAEIKHDGVDQDCNGYDLSIDVPTATWSTSKQRLTVVATSDYGVNALLSVDGFGTMLWSAKNQRWTLTSTTSFNPVIVTVQGPEGSQMAPVTEIR